VPTTTKNPSARPGALRVTIVTMAPMAALATTMQTPRPPCSAPSRAGPRGRGEFLRPRASRGPLAPRAAPSRRPRGAVIADSVPVGCVVADRVPVGCVPLGRDRGGWAAPGWVGIRRVGASAPGSPPRPAGDPGFRPLPPPPRRLESRPPQPGSRPRGSDPRESLRAGSRPGVRARWGPGIAAARPVSRLTAVRPAEACFAP
jgi:hypothetical protein